MIVRFALVFLTVFDFACNVCSKVSAMSRKARQAVVKLAAAKSTRTA